MDNTAAAIARARTFAGRREDTANDAAWLRELLRGTAWRPGAPWARAAAEACYGAGTVFAATNEQPQPGDLALMFTHHAGIVLEVLAAGVRTIEFSTADRYGVPQEDGPVVAYKFRTFDTVTGFLRPAQRRTSKMKEYKPATAEPLPTERTAAAKGATSGAQTENEH